MLVILQVGSKEFMQHCSMLLLQNKIIDTFIVLPVHQAGTVTSIATGQSTYKPGPGLPLTVISHVKPIYSV